MEENLPQGADDDPPPREVIIVVAVFFNGGLAPLSLALGWLLGHNPLATFEWSLDAALWGIVATVPLILISLTLLKWPIGPLGWFKAICEKEVVPLLEGSSWSEIALISLSVGVGDEMLCRGVLQASLTDWLGLPWGLGLASVLFGLLQPLSVPYVVMAACLGLYLGGVWIVGGNLFTVMVTHALYDFTALSYLIRMRSAGGISSIST